MPYPVNSFFSKNKIAFFFFLIFGCVCGAVFRLDMEWWDFINYHYYNAWAFLNDRLNVDVIPAFINTFFSPFIELPAYFLINALNDHPVIFSTIMAVPYGLLLFATYKIATLFFPSDTKQGRIKTGLTVLLCVCSVPVFMEISGTTHEHSMSFLVLTALYLLLKGLFHRRCNTKTFLISGFILGAAAGLKMTYCLYAAATGISLIVFAKKSDHPVKNIALFTLAGLTGFLTVYGYWGWILWKTFQNPVFPFFNSIFQSPFWTGPDYKDVRYFDLPWENVLLYPLFLFQRIGGDYSLHHRFILSHLRLVIGAVLFISVSVNAVLNRLTRKKEDQDQSMIYFLMFWMSVVYVLWLGIFRVYRYMIPFELMLSIVLVYFFFRKIEPSLKSLSFVARLFLVSVFAFHVAIECINLPYSRSPERPLLPIKSRTVPDGTLLLINRIPGSMIVPFLAKNSTIRAAIDPKETIDVNGSTFHTSGYFAQKRNTLFLENKEQKKPIAYIVEGNINGKCQDLGYLTGADYFIHYFLCWDQDFPEEERYL